MSLATNPDMNHLIIDLLTRHMRESGTMAAREVDALNAAELRRLEQLPETSRALQLSLEVDSYELKRAVDRARAEVQTQRLEDRLLALGASSKMMNELCGWSPDYFRQRRRELGFKDRGGRPRTPSDSEQEEIKRAAGKYADLPERERYVMIGETTEVALSSVWVYLVDGQTR